MPESKIALFVPALSAALLFWGMRARAAEPAAGLPGSWAFAPEYSDEFDGEALDSSKWDDSVNSWGDKWSWDPANVSVRKGRLRLRMSYEPHARDGKRVLYKSGMVRASVPPLLYGYLEARIKAAPRFPGVCSAFWAYRSDRRSWTEIDVVELAEAAKDPRRVDTSLHVFRHPDLRKDMTVKDHLREHGEWVAPWDPRDDFHVYGVRWDAEEIVWYVDGREVYKRKNRYWHYPLDIALSVGLRGPLNAKPEADGFPAEMEVDYIRVWRKI